MICPNRHGAPGRLSLQAFDNYQLKALARPLLCFDRTRDTQPPRLMTNQIRTLDTGGVMHKQHKAAGLRQISFVAAAMAAQLGLPSAAQEEWPGRFCRVNKH